MKNISEFKKLLTKITRIVSVVIFTILASGYIYEYCINDYSNYMFGRIADDTSWHYNITYYRAAMFLYSIYFTLCLFLVIFSKKIHNIVFFSLILFLAVFMLFVLQYDYNNPPVWVLYFYNIFH